MCGHYKAKSFLLSGDSHSVGIIMKLAPAIISRYVREYEKEDKTIVPRRGTIHDMGRSISHLPAAGR
jgi:hypothetical protein